MINQNDTICAQITPPGFSAIAVIRISGKDAISIVAKHFKPAKKLLQAQSHQILHGLFTNPAGQNIDEVLLSVFRCPRSYTGEDCVEISCHGNPNLVNRIMGALLLQARMANPGEFTLRAYLNGKLDLSQAEAVGDLIQAKAAKAESAALMQLQGNLSQHLQGILQRLTDARLRCELAIDFADQDLPQIDTDDLKSRIDSLLAEATELAVSGEQGKIIREGIKVCLAGAPNAGKSSLFNAFLQQNRAIVTPHPGTTRDYLEESISLSGFPLVLYDTAGLRISESEIESQGIAQSHALMQQADLILYLVDSTQLAESPLIDIPESLSSKTIVVYSKADLLPAQPLTGVSCSVRQPEGLKSISESILARLLLSDELLLKPLVTNVRHLAALSQCKDFLRGALAALELGSGYEFIAFELSSASNALEEILGLITPDDLLESIFSNFCIGK